MKFTVSPRVQVMGILNLTPDSFSDGGQFFDPQHAIDHALQMEADGASIIDIGAESTRPGSTGVAAEEQLARILPVLTKLRLRSSIAISIDTRSAAVARACLGEGATIVNDVSALRHDPDMAVILAKFACPIILMHMLGTPETMQQNAAYGDVVGEILEFFRARIAACEAAGIAVERLWLDPGVGFGKNLNHNLEIIQRFEAFNVLKRPVVAGVSRKRFLGTICGENEPSRRDAASIAAGLLLAQKGASILRVHDVAGHVSALKVLEALGELSR